jgi:hypothetical protein
MKIILILLFFINGLFAADLCSTSKDKMSKSMDLMIIDVTNNDYDSLRINFESFKVWTNMGVMNCEGKNYQTILETKKMLTKQIGEFLNGK